jgi:hypothetical protein
VRVREGLAFTVVSTVCEIFRAKPCDSAQRGANTEWLKHLASAMLRKVVKREQKLFLESEIHCSVQLSYRRRISGDICMGRSDSLLFGTPARLVSHLLP